MRKIPDIYIHPGTPKRCFSTTDIEAVLYLLRVLIIITLCTQSFMWHTVCMMWILVAETENDIFLIFQSCLRELNKSWKVPKYKSVKLGGIGSLIEKKKDGMSNRTRPRHEPFTSYSPHFNLTLVSSPNQI